MKSFIFVFLLVAVVYVTCEHMFMGTNVMRPLIFHKDVKYPYKMFQKRVEYLNYTIPRYSQGPKSIVGILAYDHTYSEASANITQGGVGYDYVVIRMKSHRSQDLHYDISIFG